MGMLVIAVGFGFAMGFGLGAFLDDVRPSLLGLAVALLSGVVVLAGSIGPDPSHVGGSLVTGSVVGSAGLGLQRARARTRTDGSRRGGIPFQT